MKRIFPRLHHCQHISTSTGLPWHSNLDFQHFQKATPFLRRRASWRSFVYDHKAKTNANEGCNSCATVVQVSQDLFYVLFHVLFYL